MTICCSKPFVPLLLLPAALTLGGCAVSSVPPAAATPAISSVHVQGVMHGGQQPVAGVTLQLYAAGNTGYGSAFPYTAGLSLLGNQTVTTNANGSFDMQLPACPTAQTPIFLVGTGGSPIAGGASNPNLALMAALGPCGSFTSNPFVSINELTTIASVWALAPFMSGPSAIGTSATNPVGLTNAFATVNKLVNIGTGHVSGPALPSDAVLPVSEINSLANILSSCINSAGGTAGDGSPCGMLFSLAPSSSGATPTNTISAAMNIALNPARNTAALAALSTPAAPYQPTLSSAPAAWTVGIQHNASGTLSTPTGIAADQAGNLWIVNSGSNSITKLAASGAVLSGSSGLAAGQVSGGPIAVDQQGNAWVAGLAPGSLLRVAGQTATPVTGGGLNATQAIAIDDLGQVWAIGSQSVLSVFSASGQALSPATGFVSGDQTAVKSVAITSQ
jgi:hypothetical protein